MEKQVEITKKYQQEIMDINNILNQLEKGRVYELSNAKMDGYLSTNIEKLRGIIKELIYKIEYGEESTSEKISREYRRVFD